MADISRRSILGGIVAGASASVLGAGHAAAAQKKAAFMDYKNEDFYAADGTFDAAKAKQAYYEMMEYFNYPIPERLRGDEFWTLDFALGKFSEVGMAGIFWINRKEDDYFGHEIYLLPGQMIPEHRHLKTADARPKMEGWHVRHGSVWTYGEGQPNPGDEERIPESHKQCAHSRCAQQVMPGDVTYLAGPEQWHFMLAGPEGAIVTEYASYHDGAALRFSHPDVKM